MKPSTAAALLTWLVCVAVGTLALLAATVAYAADGGATAAEQAPGWMTTLGGAAGIVWALMRLASKFESHLEAESEHRKLERQHWAAEEIAWHSLRGPTPRPATHPNVIVMDPTPVEGIETRTR